MSGAICTGAGCHLCMMVRDAVEDIPDEVELTQIYAHEKTDLLTQGESFDVVYIDGISFRPDGPPANKEELKQAILQRHSQKNLN
ncbi:MAG: hypothetical protein ABGY96_05040 [bacterium]|nr:hypothetical protein [Gammaproteobacteria bacterium]HIL96036.1 hypothetical protein [Pseudomonadales bacterium]